MIPGEGLATLSCGAIQSVIEARIVQLADEIQSIISGIEQNARARFPVYLIGGGIALMRAARKGFPDFSEGVCMFPCRGQAL